MAKVTQYVENALLMIIGLLTLVGAIEAIYNIFERREVALQDLLLMFLYVEVLGMVGAYYNSKQIPISFPIFIAITALTRIAILQKEQDPINLLYEAAAILMLAIASYLLELRGSRFSLRLGQNVNAAQEERPRGQDGEPQVKL
ncbi:MAG: phosphate-starvation-inducible PsiE family protein [Rhodomicrobium sp.]